jgi:hypothetical protein
MVRQRFSGSTIPQFNASTILKIRDASASLSEPDLNDGIDEVYYYTGYHSQKAFIK